MALVSLKEAVHTTYINKGTKVPKCNMDLPYTQVPCHVGWPEGALGTHRTHSRVDRRCLVLVCQNEWHTFNSVVWW